MLAFLLAKKLHWSDLSSPQAMARISWPRLLVILTIFDSYVTLTASPFITAADRLTMTDGSSFSPVSPLVKPVCTQSLTDCTAGLLVNGTGMELSETVCLLGILNCIIFYASSKILIYLFLGMSTALFVTSYMLNCRAQWRKYMLYGEVRLERGGCSLLYTWCAWALSHYTSASPYSSSSVGTLRNVPSRRI